VTRGNFQGHTSACPDFPTVDIINVIRKGSAAMRSFAAVTAATGLQCAAATLPGMWDRTVTIGSAGKTFSVTGWRLGWSIGPKHLIAALYIALQHCGSFAAAPIQVSV